MRVAEAEATALGLQAPVEERGRADGSSYKQVLRATSLVGGGKVLVIVIGLVRSKVLAILLGPAGVGVMGLLQGVMTTTSTLFGFGLDSSGVRQIAAADGDPQKLSTVRSALWRSNLLFGVAALVVLWAFRQPISVLVFGGTDRSSDIAWMGVGVLISLIAVSQMALLQGMRRIGDMVKAGLVGAFLGTAFGIAVIWVTGEEGIRWFVLGTPVFSALGAALYARGLPQAVGAHVPARVCWAQWREMASLGFYLMLTSAAGGLVALVVRSMLTQQLGVSAAGQFQAANAISGNYLGLVLGAMAADYYPRLTKVIHEPAQLNEAVNDQLEVALLLAAPLLLSVLALAPWVLSVFYSSEFQLAAGVMRWQILGDVLKVASWALGFLVLAHGEGKVYLIMELTTSAVFVSLMYVLLPGFGLDSAGMAFWLQYLFYFPLVWWIARRRYGFQMRPAGRAYLAALCAAAVLVSAASWRSEFAAAVTGLLLATGAGAFAVRRLAIRGGLFGSRSQGLPR